MSFRHDGSLLVGGGKNGVAVVEGLHDIPDKVHELIGFGLAGEAADFHDTAEGVDKYILRSRIGCVPIYDLNLQTEGRAQLVKTVCISLMNKLNCIAWILVLQSLSNLFTSHIELISVILIEITGHVDERFPCGEGEGSSCSRHNPAEPMG